MTQAKGGNKGESCSTASADQVLTTKDKGETKGSAAAKETAAHGVRTRVVTWFLTTEAASGRVCVWWCVVTWVPTTSMWTCFGWSALAPQLCLGGAAPGCHGSPGQPVQPVAALSNLGSEWAVNQRPPFSRGFALWFCAG